MITITDRGSEGPQFTLENQYFCYTMAVFDGRFLCHLYWGSPLDEILDPELVLRPDNLVYMPSVKAKNREGQYSLNSLPLEYPVWGTGDMNPGALGVTFSDGTRAARLEFKDYQVLNGAIQPEGMGVIHTEGSEEPFSTLKIRLADPRDGLEVELFYIIGPDTTALVRWCRIHNTGDTPFTLENPSSTAFDTRGFGMDLVTLQGAWARERHVERKPLGPGSYSIGSYNGAVSHKTAPYMALCQNQTSESTGRAYALTLAYSGNFQGTCDYDENNRVRLSMGINNYRGALPSGGHFDTPPAVLTFSPSGFNTLSNRLHQFTRNFIIAPAWREMDRKVIINSWEAMYFDMTAQKIIALAKEGKSIGAELLVLDDGWFSRRRDDTTSLGDWWYNPDLFPQGVGAVGDAVRKEGLDFGLWLEPEMFSTISDLHKTHPDWAIQIPGREKTEARNQLILDLANPEVLDHLEQTLTEVLTEARPDYVKWDMNRNMTEPASPALSPQEQGEMMHRYILNFYTLLGRIQKRFPHMIIEACAGGGGRVDLGLAHYCPRFWTSDQTDAVERLPIQYGTSLLLPPEIMGAHVSAVPNHQVGRITPEVTRALTALPFWYGYEMDPATLSPEVKESLLQFSRLYQKHRHSFRQSRFERIRGPLQGGTQEEYSWMVVSPEEEELFVFYFRPQKWGTQLPMELPLPLGEQGPRSYRDTETGKVYNRTFLTQSGLMIPQSTGDYQGIIWHLRHEGD